jgi:predicted TIM-barrel fold metal-dependent hydrolase
VSRSIVDWHSHVWEPEHLGSEFGPQLDAKYSHRPSHCGGYEQHRAAMAEAGVDECVVLSLRSDHLGIDVPNEYVAEYVATWNGRAIGVGSVDPNRASAVDELIYASETLGLQGIKLAPPYQDFHPHSDEAFAVYEAAAERGMFLMFHQGAVTHRRGVLEVAQPVLLDRVARTFPETKIIIAHFGQPWQHEVVPLLRKHDNVYTDLSARCARPAQLAQMLLAARDYNAFGKILWGSDFPTFSVAEHARQLLEVADVTNGAVPLAELEDILYDRPLSYLGLGPDA